MSERWRETYDKWKLATPPEHEGADQEIQHCPACGGECNDDQPCDYCDSTGYVTETAFKDYRPLPPEECL